MSGFGEIEKEAFAKRGVKFDNNGWTVGGVFRIRDTEEMMKGTVTEKYIRRFYTGLGGGSRQDSIPC
jgi:hypothetical protein